MLCPAQRHSLPHWNCAGADGLGSSLEDAVLAQTAEELSRTLEERCLSEAGVSLRLNIILSQTAEGVEALRYRSSLRTPSLPRRSGQ